MNIYFGTLEHNAVERDNIYSQIDGVIIHSWGWLKTQFRIRINKVLSAKLTIVKLGLQINHKSKNYKFQASINLEYVVFMLWGNLK